MNNQRQINVSRYRNQDNDPRGSYLLTDVTAPFDRPTLQYEWNGKLPRAGRSWRYTKEKAEALTAEGRIVFASTGMPRLKRYLSEIIGEEELEPVITASSGLEFIVRTAMKAIAIAVAKEPAYLRYVEWRDLERVLREVFEKLGFITRLTRSGNDGGFDLELQCTENNTQKIFLVEVKHWAGSGKKPGRAVFRSLFDIVARATSNTTGLLLSSTDFTANLVNGRTEIEQWKVRLGGEAKIVSLCESYLQSEDGVWLPTVELADMLLAGTQ